MKSSVLVGVTGGIAAYKIPQLVRLLVQSDLDVHVVLTKGAMNFVTPMTLSTLSCNPVHHDMWSDPTKPSVEHISLADGSDLAVVVPATANFIGKLASGIADDLLTTIMMAVKKPVLLCPAMNVNMFNNVVVQDNLKKLRNFGFEIMQPDSGFLACGWSGEGRMPEPEQILDRISELLAGGDLKGLRILVTAGPTEEPLDPVRFITNKSSGKMGIAICNRAKSRGAHVTLISGPLKVPVPLGVENIPVRTAIEMHQAVMSTFHESDVIIKAAAVADFRPEMFVETKIRKDNADPVLRLVKNPDILEEVGKSKRSDQVVVGFAAETSNTVENARKKVFSKNLDMLVLNDVAKPGAGFDYDTNIVQFLYSTAPDEEFDISSKEQVADHILDRVLKIRSQKKTM